MSSPKSILELKSLYRDPAIHWLFDYDLTLYPWAEAGVLHSLDERINAYIIQHFQCDVQEANAIRQKYWTAHGTTLAGLMKYEGVDPHHYFDFIHQGGTIQRPLPNDALKQWLGSIEGPKFVFTNARSDWASIGLQSMGIEGCFEGLFDLEFFGWNGKPEPVVYEQLHGHLELDGRPVIFFDDKWENLIPARSQGWQTVWIQGLQSGDPSQVDWVLEELSELWRMD